MWNHKTPKTRFGSIRSILKNENKFRSSQKINLEINENSEFEIN